MNSSPGQPINSVTVSAGLSIYQIIGISIIFLIFASVVSYSRHLFDISLWVPKLGPLFGRNQADLEMPTGGPAKLTYPNEAGAGTAATAATAVTAATADRPDTKIASFEQVWCLVGEDMTGRWCIQVPDAKACTSERSYATKNTCEGGM
jgi:hypothetical protein